jgi:eukaryotic-like serine/threonine-protein kinase
MTLNAGTIIVNRYRSVKLLGQGGFGAVYKAWDLNLNRACALKENLDTSSEAQRQFVREAQVLANLAHPNLPRVSDHFLVPGQGQYLVMELVEGEDLESLVQRQGSLAPPQALHWIGQIADAVQYMHSQQPPVIHRDIKPANIRITPEGRAVLVDFGLVKIYDPRLQTTIGARAVTPGYSPPEQYGQGATDARTDIYALAATLYTLLTGQQPQESVQRIVADRVAAADLINRQVTSTVGRAVQQAMALTPSQRYQTVNDFQMALASLPPTAPGPIGPAPLATVPYYAPGQQRQVPPAPKSSRRGVKVLSVVVLIAGGLVLVNMLQAQQNATATAQANATAAARANAAATATAQANVTATARANATATAQANAAATAQANARATVLAHDAATRQARAAFVATAEASQKRIFGPSDGTLKHDPSDTYIEAYESSVKVSNMVIEARFYNPYAASTADWDYGFPFRDKGGNDQFRFVVRSNSYWQLYNITGDPNAASIASGSIVNLNVDGAGSNVIKLICKGSAGQLYVNGSWVADLDLSARLNAGTVSVATGLMSGDEVSGKETRYEDFTVWSIP